MTIIIKYTCLLFVITTSIVSYGQPDYIYEGGIGGGYSSFIFSSANTMLYKGGVEDGYFGVQLTAENNLLFKGGIDGGYIGQQLKAQNTILYLGGNDDGYTSGEKCEDFIWTGVLGTGWSQTGNWNYNLVPDLKRRAIIPSGVPNFPIVIAGFFAIGDNPNNGAFECAELWIQDGALLVTRPNNFVENYGTIIIDGTMRVKNTSSNAFQNLSGGLIKILPTGLFIIKP